MLRGSLGGLFFLFLLAKAAFGAPKDLQGEAPQQKAEIDLAMKEEAENDQITMEEAGIGPLNNENPSNGSSDYLQHLSMSADMSMSKDIEGRSTEVRIEEKDDLIVRARSSGKKLEVEEDRASEVRPEGGKDTFPEPGLNEEGRSNDDTPVGWISQILDAWKSFRK